MPGYLYLGEADGGRLVRVGGNPLTQVTSASTEDVKFKAKTWDLVPAGPSGDSIFRMVPVTIRYTNGYAVRITPEVDDETLSAQDFSGSGDGLTVLQAWVVSRGARLAVTVEQLSRAGDFELVNVEAAFKVLREIP